jgi:hypothetical protein
MAKRRWALRSFCESRAPVMERAGLPSFNCYRGGVDAWRRIHRDQTTEYSARQLVAVILKAQVSMRLPD